MFVQAMLHEYQKTTTSRGAKIFIVLAVYLAAEVLFKEYNESTGLNSSTDAVTSASTSQEGVKKLEEGTMVANITDGKNIMTEQLKDQIENLKWLSLQTGVMHISSAEFADAADQSSTYGATLSQGMLDLISEVLICGTAFCWACIVYSMLMPSSPKRKGKSAQKPFNLHFLTNQPQGKSAPRSFKKGRAAPEYAQSEWKGYDADTCDHTSDAPEVESEVQM
eukprot:gnl/TRDRNA2_/TRDRNA2_182846_c0_seq1.p1 gnl/TRDRNA2_/TRDRNA2_182846_c0~~gnl/TRDRNA2_/TRDRNA2_182846_c0_seq1.p1  ORF type:complete len:222 (+),score=49.28 gnl/TRDRNA2_/TRDRNA2_182846_c0_seq1:65-730(+)